MQYFRSRVQLFFSLATLLLLSGCEAGYYWQAVAGHTALLREARPVEDVLADPATPAARSAQLTAALAAVEFAHTRLALPDNGSYATYAELDAPYVVWNVIAAPALSLEPRTWCFPVAGCVSYRGYFAQLNAEAFAEKLAAEGDDVIVSGAIAYSTLGRLSDPLLSSMLNLGDAQVAGVVFHELAHQRLYIKDDSAFNEGFASFVEREGLRLWLTEQNSPQAWCRWTLHETRRQQVSELLSGYRQSLAALYARDIDDEEKLAGKTALMDALAQDYDRLRAGWPGPPDFDHWFRVPFNNARLALFATYDDALPAFAALFAEAAGDFERFYALAEELGAAPADERQARMAELKSAAPADSSAPACEPVT